jgi:hypothetical protein
MGEELREAENVVPFSILNGSVVGSCEMVFFFACGKTSDVPNTKTIIAKEKIFFIILKTMSPILLLSKCYKTIHLKRNFGASAGRNKIKICCAFGKF